MTGTKLFLDSSVWLGYFKGKSEESRGYIESGDSILTSAVSMYEIAKKLVMTGKSKSEIMRSLSFIRCKSLIVDINCEISEKAAQDSLKYGLHAIDALIYRSALESGAILLTMDNDFRKLPGVKIAKQS